MVSETTQDSNGRRSLNGMPSSAIQTNPRHAYARAILGKELFERVATAHILVVGAGGIGCELLKNLVLVGFGHVEIIDLDTIDLSNLNRQFLFQKAHIGKPKSIVATATAKQFNPLVDITPYHANVKDTEQFGWEFFTRFDVVCNALDNLDARRWVNKMCVMTGVPLVESGTTGFLGQVQPIARGTSECYDCTEKTTPKSYPVCTIRSTPSTPIHCIVWAKTYLFPQLFGAEEDVEDEELDKALQDGENAEEIENLRKEGHEMSALRSSIFSKGEANNIDQLAARLFNKVFKHDVERLLGMEDMWRKRQKPVPLDFDSALNENGNENSANGEGSSTLQDQRILSMRETVEQFSGSLARLANRAVALTNGDSLSFDKDDQDAMDFVTATSNLRSRVYHIQPQSRFQVKEMAGNIIPAIASTNAIIAGAQVLQTLHALRRRWTDARFVTLNRLSASKLVACSALTKPNPACSVCQDDYVRARLDVDTTTLAEVKAALLRSRDKGGLGYEVEGVEMYEAARLLADEDFDDNTDKPLSSLGIKYGMSLTCVDEDGVRATVHLYLEAPAKGSLNKVDFGNVEVLPVLRNKAVQPAPAPSDDDDDDDDFMVVQPSETTATTTATKRKRPSDEEEDAQKSAKVINGALTGEPNKRAHTGMDEADAIELD